MKRAPIVLSATAAGLAATLGFQAHAPAVTPAVDARASSASRSSPSGSTSTPAAPSSTARPASTKTATGDAVANQYGNVQLRVTTSGGKITRIEAVQLPSGDPKSSEISSYAEPLLRQSGLNNQSASVDAVSGATYTSDGYRTALQSALDKTGFVASASPGTSSAG